MSGRGYSVGLPSSFSFVLCSFVLLLFSFDHTTLSLSLEHERMKYSTHQRPIFVIYSLHLLPLLLCSLLLKLLLVSPHCELLILAVIVMCSSLD